MRHFIFPKCHFIFPKCHFCHRKVPLLKKASGTRLSATANQHFISDERELSTAYYIIVDNSFKSLIYTLYISTYCCLYMDIRLFAHCLYTYLSTIQVVSCIHAWHFIYNKNVILHSEMLIKLHVGRILKKKNVYTGIFQIHSAHL